MSNANLVLDLPLDTADLPLGGTAHSIKVIDDTTFGPCFQFDGSTSWIEFPDTMALQLAAYTVELWIQPQGTPDSSAFKGIIGKPGRNYNIWLTNTQSIHHRFHAGNNTNTGIPNTPDHSIVWNQWTHVAITNDGTTARTYINGVERASGPVSGTLIADAHPLYLGRTLDTQVDSSGFFQGLMTRVRLYSRALTVDEIWSDMGADLHVPPGELRFGASHPLAFSLRDENGEGVLYALGTPGSLALELTNTSRADLALVVPTITTASASNYHFALRFRPGTLDHSKLGQIKLTYASGGDWDFAAVTDVDNFDSVYFLCKTPQSIPALQRFVFKLKPVAVDASGGSRGTNVELLYANLTSAGRPLRGQRLNHLSVLDQYSDGIQELDQLRVDALPPLEIRIAQGWETLLDTLSETTLQLRISPSPWYKNTSFAPKLSTVSVLTLSALDDPNLSRVSAEGLTEPLWFEKLDASGSDLLAEIHTHRLWDFSTDITFSVTVKNTNALPRVMRLRLECKNVVWGSDNSLYPDFYVWLPIRIGPFAVDSSGKLNVGQSSLIVQGTAAPQLILNHTGASGVPSLALSQDGAVKSQIVYDTTDKQLKIKAGTNENALVVRDYDGHVGIGTKLPSAALTVTSSGFAHLLLDHTGTKGQATILLAQDETQHTAIFYDWKRSQFTIGDPNAYLSPNPAFVIQDGGNVGIGTTSPAVTLAVGDSDTGIKHIGENILSIHTGNQSRVYAGSDGNVGIGTTAPREKLDVNGRIFDTTGPVMPVGSVLPYAGATPPDEGWVLCDGSIYDGQDRPYADLYAVIATTYGVVTTAEAGTKKKPFRVPNLCGRVPVGVSSDTSSQHDFDLGKSGGERAVTLRKYNIPVYNKSQNIEGVFPGRGEDLTFGYVDEVGPAPEPIEMPQGTVSRLVITPNYNLPHNNLQPYLALNYIIKL
jgi:microcystin-dependent protein